MIRRPMHHFANPGDSDWAEITRIYLGPIGARQPGLMAGMERRLKERHNVPGVHIAVSEGVIEVSHPGGLVGLESGWERLTA